MAIHTYRKIGGRDFHYIDGVLAFIDGRPQPGFSGTEDNWKKKDEEDGNGNRNC